MAQEKNTSPALLVAAACVTFVAIASIAVVSTAKAWRKGNAVEVTPSVDKPPPETANLQVANDGTDPHNPVLAPGDAEFVDKRGGWGWGDRCWINLKAGKWGWAKAECDKAMAVGPASPQPMASLLYNRALIAIHAGDKAEAKVLLERSLQLREHREVRAVYRSLD